MVEFSDNSFAEDFKLTATRLISTENGEINKIYSKIVYGIYVCSNHWENYVEITIWQLSEIFYLLAMLEYMYKKLVFKSEWLQR